MAKNNNQNPKKNNKLFIISICLIVIMLAGFVVISFVLPAQNKKTYTEVVFSQFINMVNNKEVVEANINTSSGETTFLGIDNKWYHCEGVYTTQMLDNLFQKDIKLSVTGKTTSVNWVQIIFYTILIGISGFSIFIMVSGNLLGKAKFTIAQSTARFSDVVGMEEIKDELLLVSKAAKKWAYNSNTRITKGILFEGPPGNGKTLLARAFAGECGMNFYAINAQDISSPYMGVSGQKINKLFNQAIKNSPAVIFIDEIDAIGSKRTIVHNATDKESNGILTTLLARMDGFQGTDQIMIIAATNRAEELDAALLRPGRFDKIFYIGNPGFEQRKTLFKNYIKRYNVDTEVSLKELSDLTAGMSCADIENVVNSLSLHLTTRKNKTATLNDFEDHIISSSLKGLPKKDAPSPLTKERAAYHEAGHAICAYYYANKDVKKISVKGTTGSAGGYTLSINKNSEEELENSKASVILGDIVMLYGGYVAEWFAYGQENVSAGPTSDIYKAAELAKKFIEVRDGIAYNALEISNKKELQRVLRSAQNLAKCCMEQHMKELKELTQVLIEQTEISEDKVLEIFEKKE